MNNKVQPLPQSVEAQSIRTMEEGLSSPSMADPVLWSEFRATILRNPGMMAKNTMKAYAGQFRAFNAWCEQNNVDSLPALDVTVSDYINHLLDLGAIGRLKIESIEQACKAINFVHIQSSVPSPLREKHSSNARKAARRSLCAARAKKLPIRLDEGSGHITLSQLVEHLPNSLKGARDRALLSVGFDLGVRSEELVSLRLSDIDWRSGDAIVLIERGKTDQEGRGKYRYLSSEATSDLKHWLELAGIDPQHGLYIDDCGYVFRQVSRHGVCLNRKISRQTLSVVIKQAGELAGLSLNQIEKLGTHSLRRGHSHELYRRRPDVLTIMKEMGWSRIETAMEYLGDIEAEEGMAAEMLRLKRPSKEKTGD